jgi:hypothetical protein
MNEAADREPWFPTQQTLMEDERGVERDALLQKLTDSARSVKRQMDAGVTPSEFTRLDLVRQGLEAATEVVAEVWRRYHSA